MPGSRPALEQAVLDNVKLARTLIRTRHSIEADREVNLLIPKIRSALQVQAAEGAVRGLGLEELRQLIYGDEE